MAPLIAVVDTGPLYAAADLDDDEHEACARALGRPDLRLVIPAMVVAEATYLIGTRLGPAAEAAFLTALADHDVQGPRADDWSRIGELVRRYSDFPLGGTDASVLALAERLGTPLVVTLAQRHFRALRPRHCEALTLIP